MNVTSLNRATKVMTWVAPALMIPTIRFLNDERENREKMLVRDLSTYTIGAAVFLLTGLVAKKGFTAARLFSGETQREFAAFITALAANILYAGIFPVRLSQYYAKKHPPHAEMPAVMVSRKGNENQLLGEQINNLRFAKWPATVVPYNPWGPLRPNRPYFGLNIHA